MKPTQKDMDCHAALAMTGAQVDCPAAAMTGADAAPRWLVLLREAVRDDPKGCAGVALRIKRSRGYVSQSLHGCQPKGVTSPDFIKRIVEAYGAGRVDCPFLGTDIAPGECTAFAAKTFGQISGTGEQPLLHWRACAGCLQNPNATPTPKTVNHPTKTGAN